MRLALYATNECPYPVPTGTIQAAMGIAGALANGLTQRGHHVTFYCPTESKTAAHRTSLRYRSLIHLPVNDTIPNGSVRDQCIAYYSQLMVSDIVRDLQRRPVDLIHVHNIRETLPLLALLPHIPKLCTVHDNLFQPQHKFFLQQAARLPKVHFVSISRRQRYGLPSFPYTANVYNGIDTALFAFNPRPKHHLLFSGRLIPEKGVDVAIEAAKRAHLPLRVMGMFEFRQTANAVFNQSLQKALAAPGVRHIAKVSRAMLAKQYGEAQALLLPIQWEEPFGLVMIEAMACGTPVIAFNRGAVAEVIQDGKTGFIVRTLPEMVRAIKKIPTINRLNCRTHVLRHFSDATMVAAYAAVYQRIIRYDKNH